MPLVVGVTFRKVGKVYYFNPGELKLVEGAFIIAETARGAEFGEVVIPPREILEEELVAPLKNVLRIATEADFQKENSNRDREKNALEICDRKIIEHNLPMKLLEAECSFDGSMITFSFSAEGRIDFRELVKDVANALKAKVQLHQIGVRDEAKLIGGFGGCGRPLCCATFLSSFEPVSMKMAKDQSLFLNPAKFSGVCGKLMCCLRYEHEYYVYAHKRMPQVGAIVNIEQGRARVKDVNVISRTLTLETEEGVEIHVPASQLHLEGTCKRHGAGCCMSDRHCEPLLANENDDFVPEPIKEDSFNSYNSLEKDIAPVFDEPVYKVKSEPLPEVAGVRFREPINKSAEVNDENSMDLENGLDKTKLGQNKNQQKNKPKTQPGKNPNRLHGHGKTKRKPSKKPQENEES